MLNWTRALSISAILGAVTMSVSASAQTLEPPLFAFFKTFCAETKGNGEAMKKAVEAAGGEVTTLSGTETSRLKMRWEKVTDGKRVALAADDLYFRVPNAPFERHVTICSVTDFSHDTAGVDAIRNWVGVPLSKTTDVAGTQGYEYTYQEVAGVRSAIPFERWFDTDDVWWLEMYYGPVGPISVSLSHHNRQYLRDTVPGQAAPTSN